MSIFKRIRNEHGFTLVELLVTVTIIGVLAAVVTVGVSGSSSTAQAKANQGTFAAVQSTIDSWLASNPNLTASSVPTATFCTGTGTTAGACGATTTTFAWYTATGTPTSQVYSAVTTTPAFSATATYVTINFADTTVGSPTMAQSIRLNAGTSVTCVVDASAKSTVLACHN